MTRIATIKEMETIKNNNINGGKVTMKNAEFNNTVVGVNNQEVNEMREQNNVMAGVVNVAVVSRKEQAVVFYDIEGTEGFYKSGSSYGGNVQLGHMVLVHNFIQKLNESGREGVMVNIQLTNNARNLLSGRRPDKLDKLKNWVELDDRKQENWKAVCKALMNQIETVQERGGNVVFTAGTGERTFKRAWAELNKISPKAPALKNANKRF